MALKNSDLFVVNRDFKSYRVNVAQMKEYFGDGFNEIGTPLEPIIITPEEGAGMRFTTDQISGVSFPDALVLDLVGDNNIDKMRVGDTVYMSDVDGNEATHTLKTSKVTAVSAVTNGQQLDFEQPNPDLQYFRPGDLIAKVGSGYVYNWVPQLTAESPDTTVNNPFNAFNGSTSGDRAEIKNNSGTTDPAVALLTFPKPIPPNSTVVASTKRSGGFTAAMWVELLNTDGSVHERITGDPNTSATQDFTFTNVPSTVNRIRLFDQVNSTKGPSTVKLYSFKLNGEYLVDKSLGLVPISEVLSVDPSTNTMLVGSGVTVSTGDELPYSNVDPLVRSGKGTVSSVDPSNNQITLATSNEEWIGPNSNDTPFYVTNAVSTVFTSSSITSVGANQVTTVNDDVFTKMQSGDQVWMSDQYGEVASHELKTSQIKTVTPTTNGLELEFESPNPDLQYFRQGDLVNAQVFAGTELCFTDHPQGFKAGAESFYAHDGDTGTQAKLATTGTTYTFTIDISSIDSDYTGEIHIWSFSSSANYEYWVIYEDGTESAKVTHGPIGWFPVGTNGKVIKYLKSASLASGFTAAFNAFSFDGGVTAIDITLPERDAADEGIVDSIDLVNNKMTLIGGSFEVGDTVPKSDVPALIKSGEATILKAEVTGGQNVITFQTSNDEWIGPNNNGTPFFVSLIKPDAPTTSTLEILTSDFELDVPNTATHESTTYTFTNMISGDVMVHEFSPGITSWVPGSAILAPFTEYELVVTYGASSGNSTDSEVRTFKTGDVVRSGGPGPVMYDENTYDTVDGADAKAKYGMREGQLPRVGIYPTVDLHPELPILHYTRVGDHYLAVHDKRPRYQSLIDDLNDSISSINI